MEILNEGRKYPKEWIASFTHMEKFAPLAISDFLYIEVRLNFKVLEKYKGRKIVYMDMEEPNRFFVSNPVFRRDAYEYDFYKILTMCPFTAVWLNKKQGSERRTPVFYPVDDELAPPKEEKIYDIIYSGGLYSDWLFADVKTISKFKYNFIAHNGALTYKFFPNLYVIGKIKQLFPRFKNMFEGGRRYITKSNIPHLEKWKIMAQTKITLVHNIVPCSVSNLANIYGTDGWEDNEAFRLLPRPNLFTPLTAIFNRLRGKTYIVPQLKSRAFEAALCRSLILCRRDEFNVIERFFEPDKEFVYYEPGKLEEKVREILANFDAYQPIIENAYQKVKKEYTTQRFFEKYLKNLT